MGARRVPSRTVEEVQHAPEGVVGHLVDGHLARALRRPTSAAAGVPGGVACGGGGVCYMCGIEENDPEELAALIESQEIGEGSELELRLRADIVQRRVNRGEEDLWVMRIEMCASC